VWGEAADRYPSAASGRCSKQVSSRALEDTRRVVHQLLTEQLRNRPESAL
jgi:hypothetical protein